MSKHTRRPGNLPSELTSMVGRRTESAEVKRLLSQSRLVTLTGTGGVGKTRLALYVADRVKAAFPGGVWLVPLAELTQADLLPMTVMSTLTAAHAGTGIAELIDYIGDREILLLLDNCEHLAEACAKLTIELLRGCPNLRVLATSRESLRVDGETLYRVPPLSLPAAGAAVREGGFHEYEATELFVERARAFNPALNLSPADEDAVLELCRRLEGLPLAIELAAGRTRTLPLDALLERQDQFDLLIGGSRSAPSRQQTLRAAVDYSFQLCSPQARVLWARLSVFAGGADLAAIHTICVGDGLPASAVEPALAELVDKSVLVFDGHRYHMLETIKEYGREQLSDTAAPATHRDYYAALAADVGALWSGPDQVRLMDRIRTEQANVRAALEYCLSTPGQERIGLRMAADLWMFWVGCGQLREGSHWLDRFLAADSEPSPERVAGLVVNSHLALYQGQTPRTLLMLDECEALAARLDDQPHLAHAALLRAFAEYHSGAGEAAMEAAIELERGLPGPNPMLPTALLSLGAILFTEGHMNRAARVLEEARALCAAAGEQLILSWCLTYLGLFAVFEHRAESAKALLTDALARKRALNDVLGMDQAIEFLAWATLDDGDGERAAQLLGASVTLAEPLISRLNGLATLPDWHEQRVRQARKTLGQRAFDAAFERGRSMAKDEALAYALDEKIIPIRPERDVQLPLTRREREIAQLVASGKTNREIAAELVIAHRTVDTHVEHILTKLGFTSRTQIAALIARAGE